MHEGAYAQLRLLPAGGPATVAEMNKTSDASASLLRVQLVAQRLRPVQHVAETSDAVVNLRQHFLPLVGTGVMMCARVCGSCSDICTSAALGAVQASERRPALSSFRDRSLRGDACRRGRERLHAKAVEREVTISQTPPQMHNTSLQSRCVVYGR